jgi:hypothetical protein
MTWGAFIGLVVFTVVGHTLLPGKDHMEYYCRSTCSASVESLTELAFKYDSKT